MNEHVKAAAANTPRLTMPTDWPVCELCEIEGSYLHADRNRRRIDWPMVAIIAGTLALDAVVLVLFARFVWSVVR